MIEELLQNTGHILVCGGPEHVLEPDRIERLLGADLLPGNTQEVVDFSAERRLDFLGFFLLCESAFFADLSATRT